MWSAPPLPLLLLAPLAWDRRRGQYSAGLRWVVDSSLSQNSDLRDLLLPLPALQFILGALAATASSPGDLRPCIVYQQHGSSLNACSVHLTDPFMPDNGGRSQSPATTPYAFLLIQKAPQIHAR